MVFQKQIFPAIFTISIKHRLDTSDKNVTKRKRIINANWIQEFGDILSEVDWGNLYSVSNPNDAYKCFMKVFSAIYDLASVSKLSRLKEKLCKIFV